jgi:hypothetical protein
MNATAEQVAWSSLCPDGYTKNDGACEKNDATMGTGYIVRTTLVLMILLLAPLYHKILKLILAKRTLKLLTASSTLLRPESLAK